MMVRSVRTTSIARLYLGGVDFSRFSCLRNPSQGIADVFRQFRFSVSNRRTQLGINRGYVLPPIYKEKR